MTSRTALVTGAARRIGAALVRDLHTHGMDVVIHYHHSHDAAGELAAELNGIRPGSALLVTGNLLEFEHYGRIIDEAYGFKGRLDVLVNNASSFFPTVLGEIELAQWQELLGVNMQAPLFLSQQAAPCLGEHGGCIVNISDIHAQQPLKDFSVYSAAKAGLDMLTRALARELAPAVRVNGLALGAVLWPENAGTDYQEEVLSKVTLRRTADAGEVSAALRFLVDEADYITGQILTLDGGRSQYS